MENTPWATVVRPQLTVVDQPTYDIGRRAAELLTDRPRRTQIRRELLSPRLVVRDSSTRSHPVTRRRSG